MEQTTQNIGTWQAWIERKEEQAHLYVQGEVPVSDAEPGVRLIRAENQEGDGKELLLRILPDVLTENADHLIELTYNEILEDEQQYASVKVVDDDQTIARLDQIGRKETEPA